MKFKRLFRVAVLSVAAALSLAASAHASFPGQNGKIGFASNRDGNWEIYSVNPDGSGITNLTNNPALDVYPVWTPDGQDIAFHSDRDGPSRIYAMKADGSAPGVLCENSTGAFAFSPDGQRLVWSESFSSGFGWLAIADPLGTRGWGVYGRYCDRRGLVNGHMLDPAWSPDGTKIAYVLDDYPYRDIYVINADGTGNMQLTSGPSQEESPDWSPDGQRIVFRESTGNGSAVPGIYTMRPDGSDVTLVPGTAADYDPVWSPDGTRIAVQNTGIDTIALDGSDRITVVGSSTNAPTWQSIPPSTGFPRPKGATPLNVSLVLAYDGCFAPNRTHAPPLAAGSCSPPQQSSANLTVGTLDSNGEKANFAGYVRFDVMKGNPATPEDEADVRLQVSLKDVRCRIAISPCTDGALSDYTGELRGRVVPRITDKYNGVLRDHAATVADWEGTEYPDPAAVILPYTIPCTSTLDSAIGSSCTLDTTLDSLVPNVIPEGKRSLWQLDKIEISDAGADGVVNPERDATTPFAVQGIFVP
jgi:hypothetical protein